MFLMATPAYGAFPPRDHDHGQCLASALDRARQRCIERGIKWTALRERIFSALAVSHRPVSAYDLIEKLAKSGKRMAPVSIYRILDVLQSAGLVHRLESRNAFFVCLTEHEKTAQTIVFLCEGCERVGEAPASEALNAISKTTEAEGFVVRNTILEVTGVCGECRTSAPVRPLC